MQEASHHGHVIREHRDKIGITQDELAKRVGRSRRTVVELEKSARIGDAKLRRALTWALEISPQLLGLSEVAVSGVAVISIIDASVGQPSEELRLNHAVFETFVDN